MNFARIAKVQIFIHTFADASPAKLKIIGIMKKTVFGREYDSPKVEQFDIKIESGFAGSTASLESPEVEQEMEW